MTSPDPQVLAAANAVAPARAVAVLAGRIGTAWKRWRNRRQVAELLALDDYLLRDLGVARGDVFEALSDASVSDASIHLCASASQARQHETMRLRESLRSARILTISPRVAAPVRAGRAA
jgi:uncharacterized protein YjiS (DUF1127 family)